MSANIPTWQERGPHYEDCDKFSAMIEEIADLRAALAAKTEAPELVTEPTPYVWCLRTGHGDRWVFTEPKGDFAHLWIALARIVPTVQPASESAHISPDASADYHRGWKDGCKHGAWAAAPGVVQPVGEAAQISRHALSEFCNKFCLGKSELVATAEAAFYAFNKALVAIQPLMDNNSGGEL